MNTFTQNLLVAAKSTKTAMFAMDTEFKTNACANFVEVVSNQRGLDSEVVETINVMLEAINEQDQDKNKNTLTFQLVMNLVDLIEG